MDHPTSYPNCSYQIIPTPSYRTCALLPNQAASGKDVFPPGKPANADSNRTAGRQREASLFPSLYSYLLWEPRPHHVRCCGRHRGTGSSCPAALIINTPRGQNQEQRRRGAKLQRGRNREKWKFFLNCRLLLPLQQCECWWAGVCVRSPSPPADWRWSFTPSQLKNPKLPDMGTSPWSLRFPGTALGSKPTRRLWSKAASSSPNLWLHQEANSPTRAPRSFINTIYTSWASPCSNSGKRALF